jgi:hypothetical protein
VLEFHVMELGLHTSTIRLHPVPFVADFALGVRMLISSSKGHCAYKDGSNCSVHVLLGSLVTSASILDWIFAMAFIMPVKHVHTQQDPATRKVQPHLVPHTHQRMCILCIVSVL